MLLQRNDQQSRIEIKECKFDIVWYVEKIKQDMLYAHNMYNSSDLGQRYDNQTFETFDSSTDPKAYSKALDYANSFSRLRHNNNNSIIFIGDCGVGKTHLSNAIAYRVKHDCNASVSIDTIVGFLGRIRKDFSKNTSRTIDEMKHCDLLVLDDLGVEKRRDWFDESLYDIINYRYNHCRPIIITTNLTTRELSEYLDERIYSRLIDSCKFVIVHGDDYRLK